MTEDRENWGEDPTDDGAKDPEALDYIPPGEDRYDALFEDDGTDYRELMSASELVGPGMEWGDGFVIAREVRASEPWAPSLVRRDERPRVSAPVSLKPCAHCGTPFKGIARKLTCSQSCRKALSRARA